MFWTVLYTFPQKFSMTYGVSWEPDLNIKYKADVGLNFGLRFNDGSTGGFSGMKSLKLHATWKRSIHTLTPTLALHTLFTHTASIKKYIIILIIIFSWVHTDAKCVI